MKKFYMVGDDTPDGDMAERIYCPALGGLSARQADLAFVMPRLDHNRAIRESRRTSDWAAILASDPFGSEPALFQRLSDNGYAGLVNWPSSILLDGTLRQSMSTIPASPEFEYAFLARAQAAGFDTLAFILSLAQARSALDSGLRRLILHPGLLQADASPNSALILGSLQRLVETIKSEASDIEVLVYTSNWHETLVPLSGLDADGFVWCEASP